MMLFMLLLPLLLQAKEPLHWTHILEVRDRHEFYENDQLITAPRESWQTLFSLVFLDEKFSRVKDCVYFRVPGVDPGKLKVRTLPGSAKCDDHLLEKGDLEIDSLKSLSFHTGEREVRVDFVKQDLSLDKWVISLEAVFHQPELKLHLSSAEYRAPKLIYLASSLLASSKPPEPFLPDKTLCHDVKDDCSEASESRCDRCEHGWHEVPNACPRGPKYCGVISCGKKGGPACRRGMRWQRTEVNFDCRTNSSYAYCARGLKVVCEGQKAYCR